jgi:hypothetical protein
MVGQVNENALSAEWACTAAFTMAADRMLVLRMILK